MNIFFQHYWSLCIDFIEDFQEISYKGIPLAILSTLHVYIDDELKKQMQQPSFGLYLRNKIQSENQIQPSIDSYLNSLGSNDIKPAKDNGKIIVHEGDLLRFPNEYIASFDKTKTILLVSTEIKNKTRLQNFVDDLGKINSVHLLDHYRQNDNELVDVLVSKAQTLFSLYNSHPVYGNIKFTSKFIEDIPKMLSLLIAYENYFDQVPVAGVIVGNTSGMKSRTLTLIARTKGIPSICTQHGIIGSELGYLPIFATVHAVFGHYEKEWYTKQGVQENCLEITGHPRFDCIFSKGHMSKKDFISELGVDPTNKLVFIPTNMTRDIEIFLQLIELLVKNPIITVLIRAHPSEIKRLGVRNYEKLCAGNKSIILVKSIELYDIIANVDLVVQDLSTVGLEAMLFEKPVFYMKKKSYFDTNDRYYYESLSEFSHREPEALNAMIYKFLGNKKLQKICINKQNEFLTYAYPQCLSGHRVADLIYKLTNVKIL